MLMDHDLYPHEEKRRNRGYLGYDSSALTARDRHDRRQLRYELDLNSWNFRIWGVAASGFLTDSYNLFASNVILASISFVYFPGERWPGLVINIFTLLGSVVGQLLFGYLADRYGRTRLYGIELVLVIVSTVGVATSSFGYSDMSFLALFTWWRFVMGIGIGAEYPLSAVITSEWSSTSSRAPMISSVFMMQPVGQALAQLVGLWVLLGRNSQFGIQAMQCGIDLKNQDTCRKVVDGIWRIVVGSGAVPALLAIIFRFFLSDCGLYTLEVKDKPGNAFRDTQRVYGLPRGDRNGVALGSPEAGRTNGTNRRPVQFSRADLKDYFVRDKNWYYLLGTASTWFFLDLSFYGFSLDNRGTLADMWATSTPAHLNPSLPCWTSSLPDGQSAVPGWKTTGYPSWQTDPTKPCHTIYDVLLDQAKQYLLTVSLSSLVGSFCFVFASNRFRRRGWLTTSFLVLAAMFVVTGGVYYGVNHSSGAPAAVVLVALCHFLFNFGANTLTFLIPAEIFPTCYRCTCHGISAAAGKLGSIVAVLVVYGINSGYRSGTRQGVILVLFGSFMLIGAFFSWAYIPDIQRRKQDGRLETKYLEELGEGRERARLDGGLLTVGDRWNSLRRRRGARTAEQTAELPHENV